MEKIAAVTLESVKSKLLLMGYADIANDPIKLKRFVITLQKRNPSNQFLDMAVANGINSSLTALGGTLPTRGKYAKFTKSAVDLARELLGRQLEDTLKPYLKKITKQQLSETEQFKRAANRVRRA